MQAYLETLSKFEGSLIELQKLETSPFLEENELAKALFALQMKKAGAPL